MDTLSSNTSKITVTLLVINKYLFVKDTDKFLNKTINKCPATMFAINRIAKVKGRIKRLKDSIQTIKNIKKVGDPIGVK
jgi:hypothetical protein